MTEEKRNHKQAGFEVKTFPVPFALEEIKENITISSKTTYQDSSQQIINQGIKFHTEGNILEAKKYYEDCLNRGVIDPVIFSNYGIILKDLGRFKEAEDLLRKAIQINPKFTDAYLNLGAVMIDLGNIKEAEFLTRKAITVNPNFALSYSNLGSILNDLGKLEESKISLRKSIKIYPKNPEAYNNLANTLKDLGVYQEALKMLMKAIEINPSYGIAYSNAGTILSELGKTYEAFEYFYKALIIEPDKSSHQFLMLSFLRDTKSFNFNNDKLKFVLEFLINKNDLQHNDLFKAFKFSYKSKLINSILKSDNISFESKTFQFLVNDTLLICALEKIIFQDPEWEKFLTQLRKNTCNKLAENKGCLNDTSLRFLISLAHQCFFNEYIYSVEEGEQQSLNKIKSLCNDLENNESRISLLACYYPLYKLLDEIPSIRSIKSSNYQFNKLIKIQIIEPLEELRLSRKIRYLGKINNDISQKVKAQYENNPYPRWRYDSTNKNLKSSNIAIINSEIKPNYISSNNLPTKLKVLIAGCGTGMQILHAQRYKNAEITAIDLSSSSLSYAQRKINEFKINNVKIIQMDLLDVSLLNDKFDIIECCGVLHHMENPLIGLKKLLDVLNQNGFMRLSLYSELSRQNVVKARSYIKEKLISPTIDNIRNFRKKILSNEFPEIYPLTNIGSDFYNRSNFVDLCFHVQEHRFTLNQIEEILILNNLSFLGFCLPQAIKSQFRKSFPEDQNQLNLRNWADLESNYPGIFADTPPFWVSRKQ